MLVTGEDPRNVASTSALVSNPTSTPSYVASAMGRSASAAPSTGLGDVIENIADWSVEKREQYVVYVDCFGHWDQQHLHHQC